MPLPPEGQPEEAIINGKVDGVGAKDVKNWEEGWYIWTSKSRWASQERIDSMKLDLCSFELVNPGASGAVNTRFVY